jgi:Na+-transporting methylmalonyl-CoA/oxaloacetate decarboxylase gamma subunit
MTQESQSFGQETADELAGRVRSGSLIALALALVLLIIESPVTILGWIVAIVLIVSLFILVLSARALGKMVRREKQ